MLKYLFHLSIGLLVYWSIGLLVAPTARAMPGDPPGAGGRGSGTSGGGITNPALKDDLGSGDPANVFGRFLGSWWGVAYVSAGVIFFLYLVWGAIEMSIAGSNKDRVENAKNKIQNAFFGLALLAVSWALIKAVGFVLGIDILENLNFNVGKIAP